MQHYNTQRRLLNIIIPLFWFAQYVYVPFLTPYLMDMGIVSLVAGAVVGAYGFSQLVLRIPLGIAADKLQNHRLFISIGMILAGISSLGLMFFPSTALLILANALSGAASSTWLSFTLMYVAANPNISQGKSIGRSNALNNFGILTAYLVGGLLFDKIGIKTLFVFSFAAGMLGLLLTFFVKSSHVERKPIKTADLLPVFKDKRLLYYTLLATAGQFMAFATAMSFTSIAAKSLGAKGIVLGICSALYTGGGICGSLFSTSNTAHRISSKKLLPAAFTGFAIYACTLGLAGSLYIVLAFQVIGGFCATTIFSTVMASAIEKISLEKRSTALGFFQSVYGLGMALGPIVMGALWGLGRASAFLLIAIVPAAFACVTLAKSILSKKT